MRELILEVILVQEKLDTVGNTWHLKDRVNIGSLARVTVEHGRQEILHILAEVGGYVGILTLDDFLRKLMETLCVEGWLQGAHFVQKNTEGPDVRLKAVGLGLDDLRRQIVWGTYDSLGL